MCLIYFHVRDQKGSSLVKCKNLFIILLSIQSENVVPTIQKIISQHICCLLTAFQQNTLICLTAIFLFPEKYTYSNVGSIRKKIEGMHDILIFLYQHQRNSLEIFFNFSLAAHQLYLTRPITERVRTLSYCDVIFLLV